MTMGTRFQIIQGGKLVVTQKGEREPVQRIRYKTPNFAPHTRRAKLQRSKYRTMQYWLNREFISALLCVALATFYGVWTGQGAAPGSANITPVASFASDTQSASFGFCDTGGGSNCVVDGDTLYYQGSKIRIADIDTPETHPSRCAEEARLGDAATRQLHALVNAGPFSLKSIDRDEDIYGRKLRLVTRGGRSLGQDLVDQGLARWYAGGRKSWC